MGFRIVLDVLKFDFGENLGAFSEIKVISEKLVFLLLVQADHVLRQGAIDGLTFSGDDKGFAGDARRL
jgi:hypothetical protein